MFILLLSLLLPSAFAEYRAYELAIVNESTGSEVKIISTLDHLQYRGFYPVAAGEEVIYVDSWRCWGNTKNFKPICPNPNSPEGQAAASERSPASATSE